MAETVKHAWAMLLLALLRPRAPGLTLEIVAPHVSDEIINAMALEYRGQFLGLMVPKGAA